MKAILNGEGGKSSLHSSSLVSSDPSDQQATGRPPADGEPSPESISQLANEVYAQDVLRLMIVNLHRMDFEVSHLCCDSMDDRRCDAEPHVVTVTLQRRKDVQQIFSLLLRRKIGDRFPTAEYLKRNPQVIFLVLSGCVGGGGVGGDFA